MKSESVSDGVWDCSEVGVDGEHPRPCLPLGPAGTSAVVGLTTQADIQINASWVQQKQVD